MPSLLVRQLSSVCRTGKQILTHKKYACNSGQSDSDLLADHTNAEIMILSVMDTDLLGHQYNVVV